MLSFLKQVFNEFSQDNCPRMAAALSYYTAFAIAPLMILLLLLAGLIFDPADVKGQIEEQISGAIGPDGAEQVKTMLKSASTPEEGNLPGSLSAIGLLFGASGVVVQLQNALNETWGVMPDPNHGGIWNFVTKRLLSIGMVLGLALCTDRFPRGERSHLGTRPADWSHGCQSGWVPEQRVDWISRLRLSC